MNNIYLLLGSIGSGKSFIGKALFAGCKLDYVSSDLYKKLFFDSNEDELSLGYRKADILAEFKMENNCKKKIDFIYELCPTNQNKIEKIKDLKRIYDCNIISFVIGTEDVNININRVINRFKFEGADPVSEDKVYSRYFETFKNLPQIISFSNSTYFIDNSIETIEIAYLVNNTLHVFNHANWFYKYFLTEKNEKNEGELHTN